jgi:glutathione synthase/RimK-type ligase-like ATP-grasp enzyme
MSSRPRRIAIATCHGYAALKADDRLLAEALAEWSIASTPVVWGGERLHPGNYDACLIRSTWDYHENHQDFLAWTREVAALLPLWNPPLVVGWNSEKTYLRELGRGGVPVVPTEWVGRDSEAELDQILAARSWEDAVVKPVVDLGARNLSRVSRGAPGGQAILERILAQHEAMVQPFLPSLESDGELSLVFVEGAFAHAVRKRPAPGDFRVQSLWGGTAQREIPSAPERDLAELAMAQLEEPPLYARVDLVKDANGHPRLIELELIEPNLYLTEHPPTARALAAAIAKRLNV